MKLFVYRFLICLVASCFLYFANDLAKGPATACQLIAISLVVLASEFKVKRNDESRFVGSDPN